MCYPKPGPRCSNHAKKDLRRAKKRFDADPSVESYEALTTAKEAWYSTPTGLKQLQTAIGRTSEPGKKLELQQQFETGIKTRKDALAEYRSQVKANGKFVDEETGATKYLKNGKLHREDGPALIHRDGTEEWHKDGELHREDGPAITNRYGETEWHKDGKLHREDGPAVTNRRGETWWYKEGKPHREDGPAVVYRDGEEVWYKDGKLHRLDGPALNTAHAAEWYKDGKLHREDGPAFIMDTGLRLWYIDGVGVPKPKTS